MTRDELLSVARSSATQLRKTWLTIARLREAEKSKEELHTDDNDNMTKMFKTLQNGLTSIDERRNNPKCKWSDCVEKFATISELHEHCVTVHAHNSGGDAPIQRQYQCQWSGCTREAFNNHAHLARHLHDHTGREEDSFLQVLIEDQAKSLTCNKFNMRWHPAVIRWCLQQHARSSAGYEEKRQAGFLRLPTSRMLQSYATFSEPKSEWAIAKETFDEMRLQFTQQQSTSPARAANVGALCFDEVKIKEGLLFDPPSDKLVGFIDNYHGDEEEPKDILATHTTQFYFKSLFSGFAFPCAYFLTRNVTADQMSEMFCTGIRALHDHGFQVLLACGDGASYNRTFFSHERRWRQLEGRQSLVPGAHLFLQWPYSSIQEAAQPAVQQWQRGTPYKENGDCWTGSCVDTHWKRPESRSASASPCHTSHSWACQPRFTNKNEKQAGLRRVPRICREAHGNARQRYNKRNPRIPEAWPAFVWCVYVIWAHVQPSRPTPHKSKHRKGLVSNMARTSPTRLSRQEN